MFFRASQCWCVAYWPTYRPTYNALLFVWLRYMCTAVCLVALHVYCCLFSCATCAPLFVHCCLFCCLVITVRALDLHNTIKPVFLCVFCSLPPYLNAPVLTRFPLFSTALTLLNNADYLQHHLAELFFYLQGDPCAVQTHVADGAPLSRVLPLSFLFIHNHPSIFFLLDFVDVRAYPLKQENISSEAREDTFVLEGGLCVIVQVSDGSCSM